MNSPTKARKQKLLKFTNLLAIYSDKRYPEDQCSDDRQQSHILPSVVRVDSLGPPKSNTIAWIQYVSVILINFSQNWKMTTRTKNLNEFYLEIEHEAPLFVETLRLKNEEDEKFLCFSLFEKQAKMSTKFTFIWTNDQFKC